MIIGALLIAGMVTLVRRKASMIQNLLIVLGQIILSFAGFLYLMLAPGNATRTDREYALRMPRAEAVSLFERIDGGMRWFIEAFINQSGLMWFLLLTVLAVLLIAGLRSAPTSTGIKAIVHRVTMCILIVGAALLGLKNQDGVRAYMFNFAAGWMREPDHLYVYMIVLIWILVGIATLIAPFMIYRNEERLKGWLVASFIALSYSLAALMWFSPTMYASGWRTLLMPLLSLGLVNIVLLQDVLIRIKQVRHKSIICFFVGIGGVAIYCSLLVHVLYVLWPAG